MKKNPVITKRDKNVNTVLCEVLDLYTDNIISYQDYLKIAEIILKSVDNNAI